MIIIHASLKVKAEKREAFLEMVGPLVAGSTAEEGNISYQLFEQVGQPNSFIVVEEWKDQAAVDFHNNTPHFKTYREQAGGMLSEPPSVQLFEATKLDR
ncbi:MAG TPA: putative quinol monooxygenase [Bacilli bacterium]|nr:putative quinol monooxygenase [Bacilli bacterium]